MENKKLLIIMFLLCNVFFLYMLITMNKLTTDFSKETKLIDNNYIYTYKLSGYNLEMQDKIKALEGVENANFHRDYRYGVPSFYYGYVVADENIKKEYYVDGDIIYGNIKTQDTLKFLAGGQLKNTNDIIISDAVADIIIEGEIFKDVKDYNGLISKTITDVQNNDFQIVGVYEEPSLKHYEASYLDTPSDSTLETEDVNLVKYQNIYNGFYVLENENIKRSVEDGIDILNQTACYSYDDRYNYLNNLCVQGEYGIDYDRSVAKGAKGLIDPDTDEYGDGFAQLGIIQISNSADKEQVMKDIQDLDSTQIVLSNTSKLSDFRNYSMYFAIVLAVAVVINLILFIPFKKNDKKED